MRSLPTDCVASVWKTIAGSVSLAIRESCSMGKITPVSLLACMIAHQQRVGVQGADELAEVQVALPIDAQERHAVAAALEVLADFQHGRVFDGRGDDVPAMGIGLGRPRGSPCCCSPSRRR